MQSSPLPMQMASAYGVSRDYKESLRRAFCRLVMEQMHRHKFEVNIHVA